MCAYRIEQAKLLQNSRDFATGRLQEGEAAASLGLREQGDSAVGCRLLVCWFLGLLVCWSVGCQLLVVGCWLLVVGCW